MTEWTDNTLGTPEYTSLHPHEKARRLQTVLMAEAEQAAERSKGGEGANSNGGGDAADTEAMRWDNAHDTARPRDERPARRILHLFSGPPGRKDGLAAYAKQLGLEADEVDILVHERRGNILRDEVYTSILRRVRDGEYIGAVIGTPCTTFSVNRLEEAGQGGYRRITSPSESRGH